MLRATASKTAAEFLNIHNLLADQFVLLLYWPDGRCIAPRSGLFAWGEVVSQLQY